MDKAVSWHENHVVGVHVSLRNLSALLVFWCCVFISSAPMVEGSLSVRSADWLVGEFRNGVNVRLHVRDCSMVVYEVGAIGIQATYPMPDKRLLQSL